MIRNNFGFLRISCSTFTFDKADIENNVLNIENAIKTAEKDGCSMIVFPLLPITSTKCGELFHHHHLFDMQKAALNRIARLTKNMNIAVIISYYDFHLNKLTRELAIIQKGQISTYVKLLSKDNYNVKSYFSNIDFCDVFFDEENQITIGEHHLSDIQLIFKERDYLAGDYDYYKKLAEIKSKENHNIIILLSCDGLCIIAENGIILNSKLPFDEVKSIVSDVDTDLIKVMRLKNQTPSILNEDDVITSEIMPLYSWKGGKLFRQISKTPYLPNSEKEKLVFCSEVFEIQANALAKRLNSSMSKKSIIGISGGLDSTLALLVTAFAHKKTNRPLSDIIAVTLPGFGTSSRTYKNAIDMMSSLGVTQREISIIPAMKQHFKDIEHNINFTDTTFENAQARERTQILMDIANKENGIVIGTGDLSEIALGWCTYNGDHMSMFGVNASVPKTMIQHIIDWFISHRIKNLDYFIKDPALLSKALTDILATPISPELLPTDSHGNISQKTEDKVGPYILHDFFIYNFIQNGVSPKKLLYLASIAFEDMYSSEFIKKWLSIFYNRFFSQQFKRNCSPESINTNSLSLDNKSWLMDSDISSKEWLKELE